MSTKLDRGDVEWKTKEICDDLRKLWKDEKLNPIVIPTALDRAAEAERMAIEVKAENNLQRKVELAFKLVDFIIAG